MSFVLFLSNSASVPIHGWDKDLGDNEDAPSLLGFAGLVSVVSTIKMHTALSNVAGVFL